METTNDEKAARKLLKAKFESSGLSLRGFAKEVGVSAPYLHDVLNERRSIGQTLADYLGFTIVVKQTRKLVRR